MYDYQKFLTLMSQWTKQLEMKQESELIVSGDGNSHL